MTKAENPLYGKFDEVIDALLSSPKDQKSASLIQNQGSKEASD